MEVSLWHHLPPMILVDIFAFLPFNDRYSAALVCRSWSEAFAAPCLWRTFEFEFEGSAFLPSYDYKALQFAKQLGHHVKHLKLSCHHPSHYSRCRRVRKNVTAFFSSLQNRAQVTRIILQNFNFGRDWRYVFSRDKIIESVAKFLRTQRRLEKIDMTEMEVDVENGVNLLNAITVNCADTVTHLHLDDFFLSREAVCKNTHYKVQMAYWRNLQCLSLNYSALDDQLLLEVARNNAKTLRRITIKCRKKDFHSHIIPDPAWRLAAIACPALKITYSVERIPFFNELEYLLPKGIPLQNLHFWTGYDSNFDDMWGLTEFIEHLRHNFTKCLENLTLELEENTEYIDDELIGLITSCRSLTSLVITAVLNTETVDVLCAAIITNNPNVHKLHLTLSGLHVNEYEVVREIEGKYKAVMHEKGIDFYCNADWIV